jgi:uncharacterized membrane protein
MSDVPIQIVVAAFTSPDGASKALQALKDARAAGLVAIDNAAVLTKDADGKLDIKETNDWGGGKGAVVGGVAGAAVGLLAGPVGWATGIGALVGGLAAKLRDSGFSDARLRKLGESLQPGTSAIVAVVEHRWVEQVEKQLAEEGANTLTEEIGSDIATQLEAGRDVAYTALSSAGVVSAERIAVGESSAEWSGIAATPDSITAASVTIEREPGDASAPATGAAPAAEGSQASTSAAQPAPPSGSGAPTSPEKPAT